MELSILLLQDALLQQKEQLIRAEKDLNKEPKFKEFRQKGIDNLKSFIAELEEGINVLTIADKQKEALTITDVVGRSEQLCQHDRSVTNRICDDCGNVITYVPDHELA